MMTSVNSIKHSTFPPSPLVPKANTFPRQVPSFLMHLCAKPHWDVSTENLLPDSFDADVCMLMVGDYWQRLDVTHFI